MQQGVMFFDEHNPLWQAVIVLFIASDMSSCGGRVVLVMMMVMRYECGVGMCVFNGGHLIEMADGGGR